MINKFSTEVENGSLTEVKDLMKKINYIQPYINRALIIAAKNGHLEVVEYLVNKGADVTARGNQALINSSMNWHLPVVDFLLNRGTRDQDYRALTRLIEEEEDENIVKRLLEYYYPRDLIENLLTKESNPKINSLLQGYLNQEFLISSQDQRLLRGVTN